MSFGGRHESEWQTRKKRIDPPLESVGWVIVPYSSEQSTSFLTKHAVTEFPTDNGPADYALFVDGQLFGIVEAKKLTLGPQGVLVQAERYSRGVTDTSFNSHGFRTPFLYATNGEVIWFHDIRHPQATSRRIAEFHTPSALRELIGRNFEQAHESLANTGNDHTKLRDYQRHANAATETAISDQKRQMLIAMATGTGKTFTLVNQAYRLLKSQVAKRILFLVDRRSLAAQAVRAFSVFEPEPNQKFDKLYEVYCNKFQKEDFGDEDTFDSKVLPREYMLAPQPKHVVVHTIQRTEISLFGRIRLTRNQGDNFANFKRERSGRKGLRDAKHLRSIRSTRKQTDSCLVLHAGTRPQSDPPIPYLAGN